MMAETFDGRTPTTLEMLDAISRMRPLTPMEERRLVRAIRSRYGDTKSSGRWYWSLREKRKLRQYLDRGKKPRQIAPLIGRSERSIWSIMKRMGWTVGECSIASDGGK